MQPIKVRVNKDPLWKNILDETKEKYPDVHEEVQLRMALSVAMQNLVTTSQDSMTRVAQTRKSVPADITPQMLAIALSDEFMMMDFLMNSMLWAVENPEGFCQLFSFFVPGYFEGNMIYKNNSAFWEFVKDIISTEMLRKIDKDGLIFEFVEEDEEDDR